MTRRASEVTAGTDALTDPADPLHLQPTPAAVKAEPGETAKIQLMLLNRSETETSDAPVIDVGGLPDGWAAVERYDQQGTWRASTREWLWLALAPEEKVRPTLTLRIPDDAEAGTYSIDATAHDANGSQDGATVDVKLPPASGKKGEGKGHEKGKGNGSGNGNSNSGGNGNGDGNGKDKSGKGNGNGNGNGGGNGNGDGNGGGNGNGNGNGNGGGNGNEKGNGASDSKIAIDGLVGWIADVDVSDALGFLGR